MVEGSMRRLGDALRMDVRLISTDIGVQLWADRFDEQMKDLSTAQEEIVQRIGQTLDVAVLDIESARSKREHSTNPDAFDLILRAWSLGVHDQALALGVLDEWQGRHTDSQLAPAAHARLRNSDGKMGGADL